jgi:6-phosphogluconate dehydrogenase
MGVGMARRLMQDGHDVVAHDVNGDAVSALAQDGSTPASSLEELAGHLSQPRAV